MKKKGFLTKTLCSVLTISLCLCQIPQNLNASQLDIDTLAAESRINKFIERNKINVDTARFTMAVASLRKAILEDSITDKEGLDRVILEQNLSLTDAGIAFSIVEDSYNVTLKKSNSQAIRLKVTFPGNEERWIYFVKDHTKLSERALKKIQVFTEEDKDYFLNGPLAGVWISKEGPSRYSKGNKAISSSLIIPLIALFSCLQAPTRCTFDVKMPEPRGDIIFDIPYPYPDEDAIGEVSTADGTDEIAPETDVIELRHEVVETIPDVAEPVPDVPEPTPDTVEPASEVIEPGDIWELEEMGIEEEVEVTDVFPEGVEDVAELAEISDTTPDEFLQDQQEISEDTQGDQEVVQGETIIPIESIITDCSMDQPLITILQSVTIDGASYLSPNPASVCKNNAAFRYTPGTKWQAELSPEDIQDILLNGINYVHNGIDHSIKIAGTGWNGLPKTIIFTIDEMIVPGVYGVNINPAIIVQHIDPSMPITLVGENLGTEDLAINGFQKQYAVVAAPGEVTPDKISPVWSTFTFGGAGVSATPTADGINLGFTMTAGDNGQSAGITVPTKSGGIPLADPNLQASWKMDGANLGTDSGQKGNTLTNVNGVQSVPGKVDNAAEFAAGSYMEILDSAQTELDLTDKLTIACWVKPESLTGGYSPLISKWREPDSQRGYELGINDSGELLFFISSDGEDAYGAGGGTNIPVGSWSHIVCVYDGAYLRGYINGSEINSGNWPVAYPYGAVFNSSSPLRLGNRPNSDHWYNGLIDEGAIFNRALTPEEIQGLIPVDSSNFLDPALATVELKARGDSPFILRLIDNTEPVPQVLDVFILGMDPAEWRSITADILQAQAAMNPAFNLSNVESAEVLILDTFLSVPDGVEFNGKIEIQGFIGMPGTRGEYAYDPDLTEKEGKTLESRLSEATTVDLPPIEGHAVFGITSWDGILTPDGLNFKPIERKFSAFHIGDTIYIPAPDMIMDKVRIGGEARNRMREALDRRNKTVLHHELHEIKGWGHKQAVLSEFEDDINGLNYADIVTILLGVLINYKIAELNPDFHDLFIRRLLAQGMPLSYNTYSEILKQTLGTGIDSGLYDKIISTCKGLVRSYIGDKPVDTDGISVDNNLEEKVKGEPGYDTFTDAIKEQPQNGAILIDLGRFFVKNDTLSDAVAIDTEYFRRFIHFARNLNSDITVGGITSGAETDVSIRQLIDLIRKLLPEFQAYHNVDFTDYQARLLKEGIDIRRAVTILSEESAGKIGTHHEQLKMIAPFWSGYNRVATVWQEFRIAVEGIEKEKAEFLNDIIRIARALLNDLVKRKQIEPEKAEELIEELRKNGIWYVPAYFDPGQYYLSIEQMKTLLTNA